jgi:hypothetical protein
MTCTSKLSRMCPCDTSHCISNRVTSLRTPRARLLMFADVVSMSQRPKRFALTTTLLKRVQSIGCRSITGSTPLIARDLLVSTERRLILLDAAPPRSAPRHTSVRTAKPCRHRKRFRRSMSFFRRPLYILASLVWEN